MTDAIVVEGLVKRVGDTTALDGVSLTVAEGTVLGLLGPNGAGKTTVVRILSTLLTADGGRAEVVGLDVAREADAVRAAIGLTGQYAAGDEYLTGYENLEMVGRLYRLPKREARKRAGELLERFDLTDAAGRPAKTYSGGMRRRLDLAAAFVFRPPVLFLAEPTTGLDPRSRLGMWETIAARTAAGTTVLLISHLIGEVERVCDRVVILDRGSVAASGTLAELLGQRELRLHLGAVSADAVARLGAGGHVAREGDWYTVALPAEDDETTVPDLIRDLVALGVRVHAVEPGRISLEERLLGNLRHEGEAR
jgi:ABC-2 type transport system ATP-binding protein